MQKVIAIDTAAALGETLQKEKKKVIVTGGCFDLLHAGHIAFFNASKQQGDTLIILLESDETIKRSKGSNRPFQPQQERAYILSALEDVDYVIPLPPHFSDKEYDELILALKPAIIAVTEGDEYLHHKVRQGDLTGAKVVAVIKRLTEFSTSSLVEKLNEL